MVTRHGLRYCLLVGVVWLLSPGMMYGADEEGSAILTVLPTDAIPAILHPTFVPAQHARVAPDVAMIGVVFNGEAHAYAAVLLNAHEIVNSEASAVYEQQVDGQLLAFKPGPMWTLLENTTWKTRPPVVLGTLSRALQWQGRSRANAYTVCPITTATGLPGSTFIRRRHSFRHHEPLPAARRPPRKLPADGHTRLYSPRP